MPDIYDETFFMIKPSSFNYFYKKTSSYMFERFLITPR